jgi:cholesterol oxidase
MTSPNDSYLPRDNYEAVVIGSGFGGAVVACRLAQAGLDVAVVERGRRWPPGSFPRDLGRLDSGWLWLDHHGLYDIRPYGDMLCVQAAGYGGGSLVYANVAIRPPAEVFEQAWPLPYRRPFLDPYYELAAHTLAIRPVPPDPRTGALPPKTQLMQLAADRLGWAESLFRPNLAVTFADPYVHPGQNRFGVPQRACSFCGECDIGCNVGAKNTLDLNYLALAEGHGAQVGTLTEATFLEREPAGYRIHLHQRGDTETRRTLTAHHVFVCAGALGSTELLLRSRDQHRTLPDLPSALGAGYSGNGDFLTFAEDTSDAMGPGSGPTITTAAVLDVDVSGQRQWFLVEDGGYSTHLARLVRDLHPAHRGDDTGRESPDHSAVFLAMGRDRADGRIELRGPEHRLHVRWNTAEHLPLYAAEEAASRDLAHALGGELVTTPTWRYLRQPVSVHNLGGCRMAEHPAAGVVDVDGQVHGHPGLYVLDGAILPAATGVNPSHTITAVAERCVQTAIRRITGNRDWSAPQTPDVRPVDCPEDRVVTTVASQPVQDPPRGIRFVETMRGTVAAPPREDVSPTPGPASFTVAVTIPDLDAFIADPLHTATLSGRVHVTALTGAGGAPVTGGTLNLLAHAGNGSRRTMTYALPFIAIDGQRWVMCGSKRVWHKRGLDLWAATTILPVEVVPMDPTSAARARLPGTLELAFHDFLRQILTTRATGTRTRRNAVATVSRFYAFFLGRLAGAFTPPRGSGPAPATATAGKVNR